MLEGELTVLFDEHECTVGRGELLRVAPNLRRQLVNRGRERVLLVAVGGAGQHESDDGEAFIAWSQATGSPPREVPMPPDLPAAELR